MRRFGELLERYGKETVLSATHQLMDYTERVLRQRIAAIPDGEYRAEDGWTTTAATATCACPSRSACG